MLCLSNAKHQQQRFRLPQLKVIVYDEEKVCIVIYCVQFVLVGRY